VVTTIRSTSALIVIRTITSRRIVLKDMEMIIPCKLQLAKRMIMRVQRC